MTRAMDHLVACSLGGGLWDCWDTPWRESVIMKGGIVVGLPCKIDHRVDILLEKLLFLWAIKRIQVEHRYGRPTVPISLGNLRSGGLTVGCIFWTTKIPMFSLLPLISEIAGNLDMIPWMTWSVISNLPGVGDLHLAGHDGRRRYKIR